MRATIDIDTKLITKAKAFTLEESCTLQSLVDEGLRYILKSKQTKKYPRQLQLTVSSAAEGRCKGINFCSNSVVRDLMDFS